MAEVYLVDDDDPRRSDDATLDAALDMAGLFAAGAPVIDQRDHDYGNDTWGRLAEPLLEEANALLHFVNYFLVPHKHWPFAALIRFFMLRERETFLREIDAARRTRNVDILNAAVGRFGTYIMDASTARSKG